MHPLLVKPLNVANCIAQRSNRKNPNDARRLNHYILLVLISIPLSIMFIIRNAVANNYDIAVIVSIFLSCMIISLFVIPKLKRVEILYHANNFVLVSMFILVFILGDKSEGQILWSYTYPLLSIFLFGNRLGASWSLILLFTIVGNLKLNSNLDFSYSTDFEIRFCIIYLTILSITSWLEYDRNRYTNKSRIQVKALKKERASLNQEIKRRIILERELNKLANEDTLTEIYNRRYFMSRASEEISSAQRDGVPLSMALIDIDKFKCVNDKYGHPAGDKILKCFAQQCKEMLRKSDIVGRFGGEEFAILLLNTSVEQAQQIMDRFRQEISEHTFLFNGIKMKITISIGICVNGEQISDIDRLYSAADKALYHAKRNGRNKVELA